MYNKFLTFEGKLFEPQNFQIQDVEIKDIAHALSRICRFNGHLNGFYSVAEHCIDVVGEIRKLGLGTEIQLCGLLHDATEAYLGDMPTPIKTLLQEYVYLEKYYQYVIFTKYGILKIWEENYSIIKEIDKRILLDEWKGGLDNFNKNRCYKNFENVELEYLNLFYKFYNSQA